MSTYLDTELLATQLRQKRGDRGLREVAREVGNVSPSTLSRVENGKTPDMDTFLKLCDWLGESATLFIKQEGAGDTPPSPAGPLDQVFVQLRAIKNLDATTAAALAAGVRAMYATLVQEDVEPRK